jgi:hypothetical protein
MVGRRMQRCRRTLPRARAVYAVALVAAVLLALPGCGKSKEETAKEDAAGKQTNEQAMNRMIQEQAGKPSQAAGRGK